MCLDIAEICVESTCWSGGETFWLRKTHSCSSESEVRAVTVVCDQPAWESMSCWLQFTMPYSAGQCKPSIYLWHMHTVLYVTE